MTYNPGLPLSIRNHPHTGMDEAIQQIVDYEPVVTSHLSIFWDYAEAHLIVLSEQPDKYDFIDILCKEGECSQQRAKGIHLESALHGLSLAIGQFVHPTGAEGG